MRIRLKETAVQCLHQLVAHDLSGEAIAVDTVFHEPVRLVQVIEHVIQREAADIFSYQHPARR